MKARCLLLALTSMIGMCDAIAADTCIQGQTGDVPGYVATCGGSYKLLSFPPGVMRGPFPFTFANVFHAPWPGTGFGTSDIFTIPKYQFISIPFIPTSGHTISLNENQTYTAHPITFSVSTAPGLFNHGVKGNGVVCVATNNPALKLSSNGSRTAQCVLNQNTQYYFNMIPAKFSTTQGKWLNFFTGAAAVFAVTMYSVN